MKTKLIVAYVMAMLLVIVSCKKDENNPAAVDPSVSDVIWPLKSGNRWIVQRTVYDTSGVAGAARLDTFVVGRDTTISTVQWYQMFHQNYFWTNKSDGAYRRDIGYPAKPPQLMYKYPASIGDSWEYGYDPPIGTISLSGTDISVDAPAGVFACYRYNTLIYAQLMEVEYVKPGLGIVGFELFSQTASGRQYVSVRGLLVSYVVN